MTGGSSPEDAELRAARTPGNPSVQDRGEQGKRAGRGWVSVGPSWGAEAVCSSLGWGGPEQRCVGDLRDLSDTCKDTVRLSLGSLSPSLGGTVPGGEPSTRPTALRPGGEVCRQCGEGGLRLEEAGLPVAPAVSDLCH